MKGLPVTKKQHTRAWLLKHRLNTKTLDEVVGRALDALAEKEGCPDLVDPEGD